MHRFRNKGVDLKWHVPVFFQLCGGTHCIILLLQLGTFSFPSNRNGPGAT